MENNVNYPQMVIHKLNGISESERYLIKKCNKTFLSLWSWPNLFTEEKKGKELCDVFISFKDHIFIFSDKFCNFSQEKDVRIAWNRWYKHAIHDSARQIVGAEKYLRDGRPLFLDAKAKTPFPYSIRITDKTKIHRIIVARGAREACKAFFNGGSGSLILDTTLTEDAHYCKCQITGEPEPIDFEENPLFRVGFVLGRDTFFHVFDEQTLDCIMDELDTVSDFIQYLQCKESLLSSAKVIIATGEEDILAQYLSTIENNQHCIVTKAQMRQSDMFCFEEQWEDYYNSNERKIKKEADKKSYLWDHLLEKAFMNLMDGTSHSLSHCSYEDQSLLFCRFAELNRTERRIISGSLADSWTQAKKRVEPSGNPIQQFMRGSVLASHPDTMIVIIWLHYSSNVSLQEFLQIRRKLLETRMLVLDLQKPASVKYIIGIAKTIEMDKDDSEDFAYINADEVSSESDAVKEAVELYEKLSSSVEQKAYTVTSEEYSEKETKEEIPSFGLNSIHK